MKKIIITGATSMLGTALINVAVREGSEIYAIVRPGTNRLDRLVSSQLVHVVYASLENFNDIDNLPSDCNIFYHFAWAGTNKAERDEPQIHEKNIQYTLNAVDLAEKFGCKRFVFAGSQAEYGVVDGIINENTKFNPVTSYGISKYAAGILSRKLCGKKNIEHVWGRIFSVYGPHDNDETMLNYALDCFITGKVAKFSSGTQFWNYLYETDAGEMFYRLGLDYVPAGTYFIAHNESQRLRKYIEILAEVCNGNFKVEFAPVATVKTPSLNVDTQKTINVLKYVPQVNFEKGVRKMLEAKFHVSGGGIA